MTLHWSWGLSTAIMLTLVIWLNGHQIRTGWLLGALVQLVNVAFGWGLYGSWQFGFLLLPAAMFLWIWWSSGHRHAEHDKAVQERLLAELLVAGWQPPAGTTTTFSQDLAAFRITERFNTELPLKGFRDTDTGA